MTQFQIRKRIAKAWLEQKVAKRTRAVKSIGLDRAKSVGIVFKYKSGEDVKAVEAYAKQLKHEGIKTVKVLGYVAEKELPETLKPGKLDTYFTKQNLNFVQIPSGENFMNFITEKFDILIDVSDADSLPCLCAVGLSQAKFKVGWRPKLKYVDMAIDAPKRSVADQFKQIEHYLKMLK